MTKIERRIIKASLYAGMSDMTLGIFAMLTGLGDWYFERFHFFGVVGISLCFYSLYHYLLLRREDK